MHVYPWNNIIKDTKVWDNCEYDIHCISRDDELGTNMLTNQNDLVNLDKISNCIVIYSNRCDAVNAIH